LQQLGRAALPVGGLDFAGELDNIEQLLLGEILCVDEMAQFQFTTLPSKLTAPCLAKAL
jgi:hypothetical protein